MRSITEGLEGPSGQQTNEAGGSGARDKFNALVAGPGGMILLAIVAIALLIFVFSRFQSVSGPDQTTIVQARVRLMNPTTGELTWHTIVLGTQTPDGFYPVEYCWNNHPDEFAVPVILNSQLFPASDPRHSEPTLCPCCGTSVVGRNPKPQEFTGVLPKDQETDETIDCVTSHYRQLVGG